MLNMNSTRESINDITGMEIKIETKLANDEGKIIMEKHKENNDLLGRLQFNS